MSYHLDLTQITAKKIYPLGEKFSGRKPDGEEIEFTNYYMTQNGKPFFGVSGEIHFSRIAPEEWEDTLIKAKMGGINIVATYLLWNVHEEIEGKFRWDGGRDVRRFLQLCQKHGLYVILRVGPFDHGEMRNGGLPDWLYGKPYEVRSCDEGFLQAVRALFREVNKQVEGLYYRQGGPVVATQLDNEYMHSAAPWEMTTGVSDEWIPGGSDGDEYLLALKKIMQEEGIITPFYTCTAWGGARTPVEEALPLWGGYSYWPWMFYNGKGEHPATPEYIYRDNHNNAAPETYNFEPRYAPESRPYACCEMMGGMSCFYNYRFALPFESVDALANIKIGSGCNLLGYYMYRGGSNPRGERTAYLNENTVPKINYDYQAALGQYGQVRPSWNRLKTLHYFCQQFAETLCSAKTVLPDYMDGLDPKDTEHLRYSVRVNPEENSGFVFLDNFQDHFTLPDRAKERITLALPGGDLTLEDIGLASGENAVLPFNLAMDSAKLRYATSQPITRMAGTEGPVWFFFAPSGMPTAYRFEAATVAAVDGCPYGSDGKIVTCKPESGMTGHFTLTTTAGEKITVVTLSRADSLQFYKLEIRGKEVAFLSDATLLWDGESLKLELAAGVSAATVCAYPASALPGFAPAHLNAAQAVPACRDIFSGFALTLTQPAEQPLEPVQVGAGRYTLEIPPKALQGHKQALLEVSYYGDIGHAFVDGELLNDDFANGRPWQTRLDLQASAFEKNPLTIYITPLKENVSVNVDSPMAGRLENAEGLRAGLESATLRYVNEIEMKI